MKKINHQKFQTMKGNMGTADRLIRILLAAIIAILYFTHQVQGTLAMGLGIAAIMMATSAIINFCPLYRLLGFSTK